MTICHLHPEQPTPQAVRQQADKTFVLFVLFAPNGARKYRKGEPSLGHLNAAGQKPSRVSLGAGRTAAERNSTGSW